MNNIGQLTESLACQYLQLQQLVLVAHNFHSRYGEIDLIMLDGECLCFIEVKARHSRSLVNGIESVDAKKQQKTVLTAQVFLQQYPQYADYECRFDVLALQYPKGCDLSQSLTYLLAQRYLHINWIKAAYM